MIIGGVAGGASTAARLRRLDEQAEIILFEKGEYISYANCGLPYYIGGVIEERERLFVQTPVSFKARFNIEVRIKSEVKAIEPENKQVVIKDWATGKTYRDQSVGRPSGSEESRCRRSWFYRTGDGGKSS